MSVEFHRFQKYLIPQRHNLNNPSSKQEMHPTQLFSLKSQIPNLGQIFMIIWLMERNVSSKSQFFL